jgi:hypothetical protein
MIEHFHPRVPWIALQMTVGRPGFEQRGNGTLQRTARAIFPVCGPDARRDDVSPRRRIRQRMMALANVM